jgi:hypothetical protein
MCVDISGASTREPAAAPPVTPPVSLSPERILHWLISLWPRTGTSWAMTRIGGRQVVVEGHTPEVLLARMAAIEAGRPREELP